MPPRKKPTKQSGHGSLFGDDQASHPSRKERSQSGAPEDRGSTADDRNPAASGMIVAHVDGGARGNPGPAGYGVFVTDAQGKMLAELSEYLGHKTNNFAEYNGMLAALDFAVKHGHPRLQVVSDSELMVKQMNGVYKVKSPELKELYDRARMLARKLERFEIKHVLRAQNKDADRLANEAMDRGSGRVAASKTDAEREVNGIVRDGVVEFLGDGLPEGTMVRVRKK
jgi:ribonuclease HI